MLQIDPKLRHALLQIGAFCETFNRMVNSDVPQVESQSEDYISISSAAQLLSCSEKTVRRKISDGELTRLQFGRNVRLRKSEVLDLLKSWGG